MALLLFRHRRHRRHSLLLRAVAAATSSSTSNSNKAVLVAQQSLRMTRLFPSSSSSPLPLTRYQKLRLSPRERDIYLRYQILIHNKSSNKKSLLLSSSSSSLLESARSNARFNLQYLKSNANTNLRKNIQTMKRLFNGEEVWKDTPTTTTTADGGRSASTTLSSSSSEADGLHLSNIDWERVPSEIMSNVKRNTTFLSEWIHDATGGKIPAFSRTPPIEDTASTTPTTTSTSTSSNNTDTTTGGGSIATRIRNFHMMKRDDTTLIMDKYWIAKNILFALLPGFVLHLYFASLQDEMAEYYGKIERMERERILGIESTGGRSSSSSSRDGDGSGSGSNVPPFKNECIRNREDKEMMMMGVSSALIPEGGDSWDKLKMVVNDLFLGGIEKKIGRESVVVKEEEMKDEGKEVDEIIIPQVGNTSNASRGHSDSSSSLPVNQLAKQEEVPNYMLVNNNGMHHDDDDDDSNVTVQMLLERIRALEARIANPSSASASASEEELQRQRREEEEKEHIIKRQVERVRQSPIKNRRDNVLEAKWKKEAKNDDDSSSTSSSGGNENDAGNGNILGVLGGMVNYYEMLSLAPYFQAVKESVVEKLRKIECLGLPPEKETSTLLPRSYDDDNNDDERESAVAMESDTVLTVDGNVGECVTSFSPVIDPSVDRHHDENDEARRRHWVMHVWQRIRKSSPFCAVSEVEDDANGKEVMPDKNQSTSTK